MYKQVTRAAGPGTTKKLLRTDEEGPELVRKGKVQSSISKLAVQHVLCLLSFLVVLQTKQYYKVYQCPA